VDDSFDDARAQDPLDNQYEPAVEGEQDIRCATCGAMFGRAYGSVISVRFNGKESLLLGCTQMILICRRPGCGARTVFWPRASLAQAKP
jgi:NMD protein affecting ribosome stability and mRNA decay